MHVPPPGGQAPPYQADWQPRKPGGGLATTSLILGIASIFLLALCGIGTLTAIVGLVLGIVAVAKGTNRSMAWVGIALSVLTLVLAVIGTMWFISKFGDCFSLPEQFARRCVEDRWSSGG